MERKGFCGAVKTIVPHELAEAELKKWCGGEATLWMYHATFKRLAIMIAMPGREEVLYVVAIGCRHMTGPFSWDGANVTVRDDSSGAATESAIRIVDEVAQFELVCSSVVLLRARAEDFDTSFDSFLGEDPDYREGF